MDSRDNAAAFFNTVSKNEKELMKTTKTLT